MCIQNPCGVYEYQSLMKMIKTVILSTALCLLILSSSSLEYNITTVLSKYPNFTSIKSILIDTGLDEEINRRHDALTLLVVNDHSITDFSRHIYANMDTVKKLMCVHVILGYYDDESLTKIGIDTPSTLTTLYQASGMAVGSQGFVNVSLKGEGAIAFGSAVPGSSLSSVLVNTVEKHPFSFAILEISSPIWVLGVEQNPLPFRPPPGVAIPGSALAPDDYSPDAWRWSKARALGPTRQPLKKNAGSVAAEVGVAVAAVAVLLTSFLVAY